MLNSIIEFLSNNFILFTSFISILTLIAIYLTIAEMKNQRKSSFRPNFVMKSQIYGIRFNDEKYLNYDILKENEMKNSSGSNEPPFISAKLFNVGLGPAKYLEFEWDYNIVNLVSLLNKNQSQFNFVIEKENDNQDELNTALKTWITGPTVVSGAQTGQGSAPKIVGWKVEELWHVLEECGLDTNRSVLA